MLQLRPETPEQPSVTLLANLPSLRFHVDQLKVMIWSLAERQAWLTTDWAAVGRAPPPYYFMMVS